MCFEDPNGDGLAFDATAFSMNLYIVVLPILQTVFRYFEKLLEIIILFLEWNSSYLCIKIWSEKTQVL